MGIFDSRVRNVNPARLDAGLVLQSKTPINETEWGACDATVTYLLWNKDYPKRVPKKGALHETYPFLGKTSHRFTENGHAPEIGTVEVLYKGAIIESGDITDPFTPDDDLTVDSLTVIAYQPNVSPLVSLWSASVSYYAVNRTYRYVAKVLPTTPRFLDATDGDLTPFISRIYAIDSQTGAQITKTAEDVAPYLDTKKSVTAFKRQACGNFFEITETITTKYIHKIPAQTGATQSIG
jgi:hypothetical protein